MNINGIAAGTVEMGAARAASAEGQKPAARPVPGPAASSTVLQTRAARVEAKKGEADEGAVSKDRAVFAVDDNKKVVIRILDGKGKLIMQIPPEQAPSLKEELAGLVKNLFSKEA